MTMDFWYDNKLEEVEWIDCYFSGLDCRYRGNMYIGKKAIGDYSTTDSIEIENTFHVKFR